MCGSVAAMSCGGCSGFFYCGDAHRLAHWASGGHAARCAAVAAQVRDADALRVRDDVGALPWLATTTLDVDEGRESRCTALGDAHGRGAFRRECGCDARVPFGALPDDRDARGDAYRDVDEDASTPTTTTRTPPSRTWPELYARLGLPLESRAALALSAAATALFAAEIVEAAEEEPSEEPSEEPNNPPSPASPRAAATDPLVVHVLGAEKELDQLDAFAEMFHRARRPRLSTERGDPRRRARPVEIYAFGPAISDPTAEAAAGDDATPPIVRVRTGGAGLYHDALEAAAAASDEGGDVPRRSRRPITPASVVVAPNAGFAAYAASRWAPTVRLLSRSDAPTLVTDYNEEAALAAREAWAAWAARGCDRGGGGGESEPTVGGGGDGAAALSRVRSNPFRQPMSAGGRGGVATPTYDNGFAFVHARGEASRAAFEAVGFVFDRA